MVVLGRDDLWRVKRSVVQLETINRDGERLILELPIWLRNYTVHSVTDCPDYGPGPRPVIGEFTRFPGLASGRKEPDSLPWFEQFLILVIVTSLAQDGFSHVVPGEAVGYLDSVTQPLNILRIRRPVGLVRLWWGSEDQVDGCGRMSSEKELIRWNPS